MKNKNRFYFLISLLYILVTIFANFIASIIPSSLDFLIINSDFMEKWKAFLDEHCFSIHFLVYFVCFFIPVVICLVYSFSILFAKTTDDIKRKITNIPFLFSMTGVFGWVLNFLCEFFMLLFVKKLLQIQISNILLISGIFIIFEGLLSFELSYYILEALNRTWVLKKLFPNGGVTKTKGVIKPSFSMMFVEFFIAVSICPVFFLLYSLISFQKNNGFPIHVDTMIIIAMFMIIAILVTIFFMRIFTVPIKKFSEATKRIKNGDFSTRINIVSNDKFGTLCDTFNDMSSSLKEKEFMRDTFGKIVDPYVRDYLLKGNISLGGENRTVTVMFCDIRNFTAMSEKMPPEEVVALLNQYFTKIGECISKNHGIINKYIGDAVMAIFGAPVESANSAEDALNAAFQMRNALFSLNEEFKKSSRPEIRFGIGLHTGNVLAGNIGAENRMEYTVIGDTVNTASRLESLCKIYKTDLLFSQSTLDKIDSVQLKEKATFVDNAEIRGKHDKVQVYTI